MKVAVILPIILLLAAFGQIESGTLIIVNASQNEIIVAADSRGYNQALTFDDRCKITALGNQLIFAAAGKTSSIMANGTPVWDSHAIARNIFLQLSHKETTQPLAIDLATAWGNEIKDKLKADLTRDREDTLFGVKNQNILVNGLFATFDQNSPLLITVDITYSIAKNGSIETNSSVAIRRGELSIQIGENDIASELFDGQTERARNWANSLKLEPGLDKLAVPAVEAIKFSIANYEPVYKGDRILVPIGGEIDVAKLTQSEGAQWLQRKGNCPEN